MRNHPEEHRNVIVALGRYVRDTRRLLGWSQERLSDEAHTSQGLISRVERGHCLDVPFLTVMKVLTALAAVVADIDGAVPPPFRVVLACVTELSRRDVAPPDPHFAQLLHTYHAIPAARQAAFVDMLRPLAAMFEGQGADALTEEPE